MLYEVKLSTAELDALAVLIGTPLDRVVADGWAVELYSGARILPVLPSEAPTPDTEHPQGDVERPMLCLDGRRGLSPSCTILGERLGLVRAVNVISLLVGFTPVIDCPPIEIIPGVLLPQSQGYGWTYFPPGQLERATLEVEGGSLVDLDVAFELVSDNCPSLVVYTRGYFINASLLGPPANEEWVRFGTYARHPLGVGGQAN